MNTFLFIQRTEQVLIELDISAIEKYVIIIIMALTNPITCSFAGKRQEKGTLKSNHTLPAVGQIVSLSCED